MPNDREAAQIQAEMTVSRLHKTLGTLVGDMGGAPVVMQIADTEFEVSHIGVVGGAAKDPRIILFVKNGSGRSDRHPHLANSHRPSSESQSGGSLLPNSSGIPQEESTVPRRTVDILRFLEAHPDSIPTLAKTPLMVCRYEEALRLWQELGRPDPESLPAESPLPTLIRNFRSSAEPIAPAVNLNQKA